MGKLTDVESRSRIRQLRLTPSKERWMDLIESSPDVVADLICAKKCVSRRFWMCLRTG